MAAILVIEGLLTGEPQVVFWVGIVLGFLLGCVVVMLVRFWRGS